MDVEARALPGSPSLRVVRLSLAAGEALPGHPAPGDGFILCLRGRVRLRSNGRVHQLGADERRGLLCGDAYALEAGEEPATVLLVFS